jgi:leader peptidase (prepilin peptidase) / N-methyltransferase
MLPVAVIFGFLVGSFLNVVIVRLPEGRSLVDPGSACGACGTAIAWHDNVPLLSFVALRGRCRACGIAIPWRYPVVEAATGALFGLATLRFGATPELAIALVLLALLVVITGIDLRHQIIPDVITLPGIGIGLVANLATGRLPWLDPVLGVAVGGGIFFVIILASRGGMGGGDMKLGAMLGAFLGWQVTLLSILLSVLLGGAIALVLLASGLRGRKEPIPFGPFLSLGGAIGLFWGDDLLHWYLAAFPA